MIQKNSKERSDEYYTTKEQVDYIFNNIDTEFWYDKCIICAADNESSEFVKYFINNKEKLKYKKLFYKSRFDDPKYDMLNDEEVDAYIKNNKNVVYITNPPFSISMPMLRKINGYIDDAEDFKFLIFQNLLQIRNIVVYEKMMEKLENEKIEVLKMKKNTYKCDNGYLAIPSVLVTNIKTNIKNKSYEPKVTTTDEGVIVINRLADIKKEYTEMWVPVTFLLDSRFKMYEMLEYKDKIEGHFNFTRIRVKRR